MEQKVLIIFSSNWADEFDVEGFAIMDEKDWEEQKELFLKVCKAGQQAGYYFGTNEGWEDDEITEKWLEKYKVKKISEQEVKMLNKLFDDEFGLFPSLDDLSEYYDPDEID